MKFIALLSFMTLPAYTIPKELSLHPTVAQGILYKLEALGAFHKRPELPPASMKAGRCSIFPPAMNLLFLEPELT